MIPKHLLINFDELKVGQRVWTMHDGYTDIIGINPKDSYPIKIKMRCYCKDGREYEHHFSPSLFLDCPFIEEERVVEVSLDFQTWYPRKFIKAKDEKFICWTESEDDIAKWKFMRELQPEPIKEKIKVSKDDIAKLMGCGVEDIEIV